MMNQLNNIDKAANDRDRSFGLVKDGSRNTFRLPLFFQINLPVLYMWLASIGFINWITIKDIESGIKIVCELVVTGIALYQAVNNKPKSNKNE